MPSPRRFIFANGEYYHVFNRGVEKRITFTNNSDFRRAIETLNYYRFKKVPVRFSHYSRLVRGEGFELLKMIDDIAQHVEIIAYCLMDNHFHFLLRQLNDDGISIFMSKFTNSYTKYFNTKHERVGPLFQGIFKAVHIMSDEQLLHVNRYIHLNPVVGFLIKKENLGNYIWSSYPEYLKSSSMSLVEKKVIMGFFKDIGDYQQFVLDQADYAQKQKIFEHLSLE